MENNKNTITAVPFSVPRGEGLLCSVNVHDAGRIEGKDEPPIGTILFLCVFLVRYQKRSNFTSGR